MFAVARWGESNRIAGVWCGGEVDRGCVWTVGGVAQAEGEDVLEVGGAAQAEACGSWAN